MSARCSETMEYVGEVGGADKLALLANATCLLNPVAWPEPVGMVMIESLACGTPVGATPHGSVPELIVDGVTGLVRSGQLGLVAVLQDVHRLDRARCRKEAADRSRPSGWSATTCGSTGTYWKARRDWRMPLDSNSPSANMCSATAFL